MRPYMFMNFNLPRLGYILSEVARYCFIGIAVNRL